MNFYLSKREICVKIACALKINILKCEKEENE